MRKSLMVLLMLFVIQITCFADDLGYGIKILKQDDSLIIEDVLKNSKADKAGLKAGQKIISINGKKAKKILAESLNNIDKEYKKLSLVTDKNTTISLKPENITLVETYNNANDTYNENTKYKVENYKTDNIILANFISQNKYANYTNAYSNYADSISIKNSQDYVNLFKITQDNVEKAIIKAKNDNNSQYYSLYEDVVSNSKNSDSVIGKAFKYFLELSLYSEQNKDLINRQISEFNQSEKKIFTKYTYNTRILANLYYQAKAQLQLFSYENKYNASKISNWEAEFLKENKTYNDRYKELTNIISKNKIEFNSKPGPISDIAQTGNIAPATKFAGYKQMNELAKSAGYNLNDNPEIQKITAERIKQQKAKEEAAKKLAAEQAAKAKAEAEKQAAAAKAAQKAEAQKKAALIKSFKRTGNYKVDIANAFQISLATGDDTLLKSILNEGINVYQKKVNAGASYADTKTYCELVRTRMEIDMSSQNKALLFQDGMNYESYCQYMK